MTEKKVDIDKELAHLAKALYEVPITIDKKDLEKALDIFRRGVYSCREDMSVKQFKVQIAHILSKTLSELI